MELMQVEPPLVGEITQVLMLYPGSVVPLVMFFIDAGYVIAARIMKEIVLDIDQLLSLYKECQ